jgi:Protein of unknown function (DUF3102)
MTKRIPSDNRILAKHAAAIRRLGKRVVADVIEIGRLLAECKRICGHGNWLPWLDREFGWTDDTALNFMRVYELSKSRNFRDLSLPLSGLYLLAAPSTPQEARDEIIERAQAGETIPVAEAKHIIEHAKDQQQPCKRTKPQAAQPPPRDDIDPASAGELARLRDRIEGLQAEKRRLQIKIGALENEVEEAKTAAKPAPESKSASQCSICRERKRAMQRSVFICDDCVHIFEVADAAPPDDGLDIPESLRREPAR